MDEEDDSIAIPEWVVTFGDMMSLLLTFFILLVSFSTIQEAKFQEAIGSLKGAFGVLKALPSVPLNQEILRVQGVEEAMAGLEEKLVEFREGLEKIQKSDKVEISRTEHGLAIRLDQEALFDSGKSELHPEALPILDGIVETLVSFPNAVRIEGHTDNLPIHSELFPSNWELSAARATAVLRRLQAGGIDPRRLSATGLGEWRPVANNDSPENRQRNRRVEIFMDILTEQAMPRLGEHL
jgi:chemotaxis protein MotB